MRVLVGVALSLFLMSSIAYMDGRMVFSAFSGGACLISMFVFSQIRRSGATHGSLMFDRWYSREGEEEMRVRLQREMDESSVENLGSNWARMEMDHLEAKLGEEE
jgi:type II secretory pathway component PulK|tara:strand:- start:31417 stop:31731 length:315 start_codon:yes stop_codon:yes gene_type:complete